MLSNILQSSPLLFLKFSSLVKVTNELQVAKFNGQFSGLSCDWSVDVTQLIIRSRRHLRDCILGWGLPSARVLRRHVLGPSGTRKAAQLEQRG